MLCSIYQYPNTYGEINGAETFIKTQDGTGKAILVTDLLALTLLKPPGEMGADIVVGNLNVLVFLWVTVVLMQHFLQLKMNLNVRCQED